MADAGQADKYIYYLLPIAEFGMELIYVDDVWMIYRHGFYVSDLLEVEKKDMQLKVLTSIRE